MAVALEAENSAVPAEAVVDVAAPKRAFLDGFRSVILSLDVAAPIENATDYALAPLKEAFLYAFKREDSSLPSLSELNLDTPSRLCSARLISSCLGPHLASSLSASDLSALSDVFSAQISRILTDTLRFPHQVTVSVQASESQSRLLALQAAMHRRYPLLASEGCASLSRSPVFYGTEATPLFQQHRGVERERFAWSLMQNKDCFRVVPASSSAGSGSGFSASSSSSALPSLSMDLECLASEVDRDKANGRLPCAVLASCHDDVAALRRLCDRHGLWLHVDATQSDSLLLAAASPRLVPPSIRACIECADSISARPLDWLSPCGGMSARRGASGPAVTFVRVEQQSQAPPPADFSPSQSSFQDLFFLWFELTRLRAQDTTQRVDHSLELCAELSRQLSSSSRFTASGMGVDQASQSHVPNAVLFQITPTKDGPDGVDVESLGLSPNAFNELLGARLEEEDGTNVLGLMRYRHAEGQHYLLFRPLAIADLVSKVSLTAVTEFAAWVDGQIRNLKLTAQSRPHFEQLLSAHPDLEFVPASVLPGAVSMNRTVIFVGAFRFVPTVFVTEQDEQQVAALNQALAQQLQAKHQHNQATFLPVETQDFSLCVGVVADNAIRDPDFVSNTVAFIVETASKLDFPPEILEKLSALVSSSISTAEEQIRQEELKAFRPENLLRKIPIVGSVFGWLRPEQPDAQAQGRTFQFGDKEVAVSKLAPLTQDESGDETSDIEHDAQDTLDSFVAQGSDDRNNTNIAQDE